MRRLKNYIILGVEVKSADLLEKKEIRTIISKAYETTLAEMINPQNDGKEEEEKDV